MSEDYGENMGAETDSLLNIGSEIEADVVPSESEFASDAPGELIENVSEMEDLPREPELAGELQEGEERFEDDFENKICSMTLADLKEERERLLEMGAMSGDEIAEQYDSTWGEQGERDATDRFLDNFNKDQLLQMRDALSDLNGGSGENPEGTDDTEDKPPQLKLTLKRRL